ncbi:MAG: hypothetical protein NT154_19180 [Verrucomicrobia bacterium]|nr:hypothetical protein [Verrucomicrobiota bacterium]
MKIIDVPQSGKLGTFISYKTRYGQFRRPYVVPSDPQTPAQLRHRRNMGLPASRWRTLSEKQRATWMAFAAELHSGSHLGQSGRLAGFNLFVKINSNLADIGEPQVVDPPDLPQFGANPVGDLTITNDRGDIAIKLSVSTAPARHTLVFATMPLSPGRSFPGRFVLLGLLPEPVGGFSDITDMYVARFGALRADRRVFIRTLQQINGWKDLPKQTTAVAPTC